MLNFSNYFNLSISGHKDIEFIDVPVDTDVRLFLDPGLIESGGDNFSKACTAVIKSYFNAVFDCCRSRDHLNLPKLLNHSAEPNETHLGNSIYYSKGHGASEQILYTMFSNLIDQELFERDVIHYPCDLYVFAPNFDKDRMSDLLTNILRDLLSQFTKQQCDKHGILLKGKRIGCFWDPLSNQWQTKNWQLPIANGKPVLLVPKSFVSRNYHFSTSSYINKYLLEYRQRYHLENHTDLCYERLLKNGSKKLMPPKKSDIRLIEFSGVQWKQEAIDFACKNPDTMLYFDRERKKSFADGCYAMSNYELDLMLYSQKIKTA
ncbi:MAG: hypothetical protein LKJ50_03930 [Clostridiales bacterium]|jgi:hypothetical protein|nr:hypothetical protein [Clostridiales bacterium]MCI1961090.1 hypothetical protein [Clostridiales bacterium]MCI2021531.1 hypothetical protein [Clostridiales bacterium]MCI2026317.1 hypothetical protein [Clostridiales bacterium]